MDACFVANNSTMCIIDRCDEATLSAGVGKFAVSTESSRHESRISAFRPDDKILPANISITDGGVIFPVAPTRVWDCRTSGRDILPHVLLRAPSLLKRNWYMALSAMADAFVQAEGGGSGGGHRPPPSRGSGSEEKMRERQREQRPC